MNAAARKIIKAIYLLVEKHHRLYGLEVYLFSGGHGAGYVGFQVAGKKCAEPGEPTEINYGYMHPESTDDYLSLVTYLCGPVRLCDWSTSSPVIMDGWEKKRTAEIASWLEENLTLRDLYERYSAEISRWRDLYTVSQSEQYLLMLNIAGLISARSQEMLRIPSQCFDYDQQGLEKATKMRLDLGVVGMNDAIGLADCMIGRNGRALIDGQLYDLWEQRLQGVSATGIADWIWSIKSGGSR
jgi:hypothetical protein